MHLKPPHVAAIYSLIALGCHQWISWIRWPYVFSSQPLGWLAIAVGINLPVLALRLFERRDTTHDPHGMPTALVTDGLFRYTRNPMYLGVTSFLTGIALLMGTLPFYLVPLAFALTMHLVFIPREERRLTHLFGDAYTNYTRQVRRWL